ncbi:hypothetical protein B5F41_06690 [Gordonibacter sp. An232A]|nr:hypothetical protein B5F41_06690 [Gordonibacter sp. An232A]
MTEFGKLDVRFRRGAPIRSLKRLIVRIETPGSASWRDAEARQGSESGRFSPGSRFGTQLLLLRIPFRPPSLLAAFAS